MKKTTQEMNRLSVDEFKQVEKIPLIVVLDNVRSLHNIGSVFRTADAFRVQAIYLCGMSATPPNNEMHKTALGAELTVDWLYFPTTMEAVTHLREQNYTILSIEQAHNSISLEDVNLCAMVASSCQDSARAGFALILGHEVFGVAQEVVDASDVCVEIPQFGTKHSLNVSVTAGIVIHDFAMQLMGRK